MTRVLCLIYLLLVAITGYARPINLMVFGDSLSVGYHLSPDEAFYTQLEKALKADGFDVKVLNYSKSGETSAGGLANLSNAMQAAPDAVLLELGINDALRGLSVAQTRQNLQAIITAFKNKKTPVFLIGMEAPILRDITYRQAFKEMFVQLAQTNQLMLYPFFMDGLWKSNGEHKNLEYFLSDMAHPSAKGVSIMTKKIVPKIKQFMLTNFGRKK